MLAGISTGEGEGLPRDSALERSIRARLDAGDVGGAASEAVRRYGPEVLGWLVALHHDHDDAGDVFAATTEALWGALPGFRWECSLRTWMYAIARRVSLRYRRDAARRGARLTSLEGCEAALALANEVRSSTLSCLRSDNPNALTRLRDELPEPDRALLVLRVDRGLAWMDLARVFLGPDATDDAVSRESARLRKRFQLVRGRLAEAARERGLFGS
jgi:RNA polymerase sigma-70 factor, ECF subfamily